MTTFLYPQGPPRRTACPHCLQGHFTAHGLAQHVRDTGAATELPPGRCPVLFAARNRPRPDAIPASVTSIVWIDPDLERPDALHRCVSPQVWEGAA